MPTEKIQKNKMGKRKKFSFWKRKKGKIKIVKVKVIKEKGLTREQIGKKLLSRKEQTAKKILESRGASPAEKARARKILKI